MATRSATPATAPQRAHRVPLRKRIRPRERVTRVIKAIPAPSDNPITNLIITDIVLRGGLRLMRRTLEHLIIGAKHSPGEAHAVMNRTTLTKSLIRTAVARYATRSPQGAMIVGASLLVKVLYDRAQDKRAERRGAQKVARTKIGKRVSRSRS